MLVIVSDLHLTDGTTGMCIPTGAFELFRERLEDMAYDASQRGHDTYQPIESFDLLLLGDIFDLLRSTQWTKEEKDQPGYARPWSRPDDPAFVNKVGQITDKIIEENSGALKILQQIASGTGISVPPATKNHKADLRVSRDSRSDQRLPVQVRIHYMIGNHDWYYHLPGAGLDRVRRKIVDAMGLSNKVSPFPYVPSESDLLNSVLRQHGVFCRHGDFHDPYNIYKKDRDHASISDAVCVELFNRIAVQIRSEFEGRLPQEFFDELNEMGSIRPELMTPVWIASLLDRHQLTRPQRERIDEIWHQLVERFAKLDFLDELDEPFALDQVDAIQAGLKFAGLVSIDKLNKWALTIQKLEERVGLGGGNNLSFKKHAVEEEGFKSGDARYIVFGHTHQFAVHPLRTFSTTGTPCNQMYLNAGTWHPVHEICETDSNKKGFVFHKTMGYLGIYRGDERRCKGYEGWSGTLDI